MPLLVDESILLLLVHFVVCKFRGDAVIEAEGMLANMVLPYKCLCDFAAGARDTSGARSCTRRRWMKPTIVIFTKCVEKSMGLSNPSSHCFGQARRAGVGNGEPLTFFAGYSIERKLLRFFVRLQKLSFSGDF